MGYAADYPDQWLADPRFIVGLGLFVAGAALNVWSDYRLRHLRRKAGEDRVSSVGATSLQTFCVRTKEGLEAGAGIEPA